MRIAATTPASPAVSARVIPRDLPAVDSCLIPRVLAIDGSAELASGEVTSVMRFNSTAFFATDLRCSRFSVRLASVASIDRAATSSLQKSSFDVSCCCNSPRIAMARPSLLRAPRCARGC